MADAAADAQALKAKGNAAFQSGDFHKAVAYFKEAIEKTPNDHVLYSNLSGAHASLKNYDDALDAGSRCISLNPNWAKGYSRKGFAEFQLGRVKSAIETYKQGLKVEPQNAALLEGLKQAEMNNPELLMQMQLMLRAESLLKTSKYAKYTSDDAQFPQTAMKALQQMLQNPQSIPLVLGMCPDHRVKELLTDLLGIPSTDSDTKTSRDSAPPKKESAKPAAPKSPEAQEADEWKNKGNALYKSRQFTEALAAYDKAIAICPSDLTYQLNKSAVYLEMGEIENCLQECQTAIDKSKEVKADYSLVAKIYTRMAAAYKRKEDLESAIAMYERSLLEDNTRPTRAALADLKRAKDKRDREAYINPQLAEELRLKGNDQFKKCDFPEAKKSYDEAIRRNPSDAKLYANRSATLMKLAELPSALKDIEKSLELDANFVKAYVRKGNIHVAMKDYNKALNAFQGGLKIDPANVECQQALEQTLYKIQAASMSDVVDAEQLQQARQDPEIQAILSDPQFNIILSQVAQDPSQLREYCKDAKIANGIQKLMAAGILRMGPAS